MTKDTAVNTEKQTYSPRLFALSGRIDPWRFWGFFIIYSGLYVTLLILAAIILIPFFSTHPSFSIRGWPIISLVLLYLISFIPHQLPTRRRLMDLNVNPNWSCLLWAPVVNLALVTYLVVKPGSKLANRFGPSPKDCSGLFKWFCLAAPFVIAFLVSVIGTFLREIGLIAD